MTDQKNFHITLAIAAILLAIVFGSLSLRSSVFSESLNLFNDINAYRTTHDVDKLQTNGTLNKMAQDYADEMATKNFFSHTSPTGKTFPDRVRLYTIQSAAGENLAAGQRTSYDAVQAWAQSKKGHKENMLSYGWKYMGVGHTYNRESKYGHYWVAIFTDLRPQPIYRWILPTGPNNYVSMQNAVQNHTGYKVYVKADYTLYADGNQRSISKLVNAAKQQGYKSYYQEYK